MASIQKYFLGPQLLGDIRRVVGRVDAEPIGSEITRIPTRLQDMRDGGGGASLRFVSWTQTWSATATATFTFKGGAQTAVGVNTFAGVGPGDGWVTRHQGTWHLVVVSLTMQSSYTAQVVQMLGHDDDGILRWYTTIDCEE